jgi:predicted ATPase/DNA-binding SARP family transcriptional activator
MLEIRLFGPPALTFGGEPLRFSAPPRTMALLVYVVLHPEPLLREQVAWAVWPDTDEDGARANLRRHLYLLRNTLPSSAVPWIRTDPRTIAWNAQANARVDVHEFERLSAQPETRLEAIELCTGELAEGIDDEWIAPIRERLHDRQIANLFEAVQTNRQRGDLSEALEYAQRLVRFDQWHEAGIRSLIVLRHASGDRAGALQEYRGFERRLRDELGVEPMPETVAAYRAVLADGQPEDEQSGASADGFPRPTTTFYGREHEMERVGADILDRRLVTLCGPGGVGKTRLATEIALSRNHVFADGIRFVDLASVDDDALLPAKIAFVLRVREQRGSAMLDAVIAELRAKHLLLVIDNCEHMIEAVASAVERIIEQCPRTTIILTSRAPAGVAGEVVRRIEPFDVPRADDARAEASANPAVALFLDRAADRRPFPVAPAELPAVVRICRRLDGLPLAIELAAALMGALSAETLARDLDERFTLVGSTSRTSISRHRTLRATLTWSYDLLPAAEARLFRSLGIFRGSFTPEGACAIGAPDDRTAPNEALALLTALVEKSMITFHAVPGSAPRYRMLESARAYALESLDPAESLRCRRRHARFHRDLARRADAAYGTTPDEEWLGMLGPSNDDFQAALDWAIGQRGDLAAGAELAASLTDLWLITGQETLGIAWLERATAHAGDCDDRTVAALWSGLGALYRRAYRFSSAADASRRSLDVAERIGDERLMPRALTTLGVSLASVPSPAGQFDTAQGRELVDRAHAIARRYGDHLRIGEALFGLAIVAAYDDEEAAAMELFEQSLAIFRNLGKTTRLEHCLLTIAITAYALADYERAAAISRDLLESRKTSIPHLQQAAAGEVLGLVALERGDLDGAAAEFRRALSLTVETQLAAFVDVRLANFALLEAARRNDEAAARYFGYIQGCAANGTWSAKPFYRRRDESVAKRVRGRLGERGFRAALQEGSRMDQAAMVATALFAETSCEKRA